MRRLLNKKGSVLFLVVVVMSILIIAASATFYIVNNQHSSVNVRYSSEQSYQTAVSVSNTVSNYIDGYLKAIAASGNEISDYSNTLIGRMVNLPTGGTADITSSIDLSDVNMGKASVSITKKSERASLTNPKNTTQAFEICTKSTFKDETVTITEVIEIETGPTNYFTRFLTSTGKDGRDVLIGAYKILSDAYFENDYTVLGINGQMAVNDSMYCSGTLVDEGIGYNTAKYTEMAVAENFYIASTSGGGSGTDYSSNYAINNAYIGGNFYNGIAEKGQSGKQLMSSEVYILGNYYGYFSSVGNDAVTTKVYVNGDCHIKDCDTTHGTLYINGNLYIENQYNNGTYYVYGDVFLNKDVGNGNIQCKGTVHDNGHSYGSCITAGASIAKPFSDTDVASTSSKITSNTSRQKYRRWEAEKHFNDKNITATVDLNDPSYKVGEYTGNVYVEINEDCILYPATSGWSYGYHTIVVDAGNTVTDQEPMYIKLMPPAGAPTVDGKKNFAFSMDSTMTSAAGSVNVLVKGERAVVFIVPENVNFIMNGSSFIGHLDIARYLTGMTEDELKASTYNLFRVDDIEADTRVVGMTTTTTWHAGQPDEVQSTILSSAVTAVSPSVHNNIFLVTSGNSNQFYFNGESSVFGYVYAPDAYFKTSDTSGRTLSFVGGMIVGSYDYNNGQAVLVFTTPYDYMGHYTSSSQSPSDIVKVLIGKANGAGSSDSATLQGFSRVGYK